jgi:phospholipid/cholesterol/gamma-HCH transport system substrate-binding protein
VGSVEEVRLNPETQKVRVRLQLERGPTIPEGSRAKVSGISALGGVHVKVLPGPKENPQIAPGTTLAAPKEGSSLKQLTAQAPALASKADSLLTGANTTIASLNRQLQRPDSDLQRTLSSLRKLTGDLEEVSSAEKENIQRLIQNLERVSSNVDELTSDDSLGVTVHRLNESLDRLNRSLASFEKTSATLDKLTTKLNEGEGTAGRLVNDPGLYLKMDSAAARTNAILRDFQENPGRYLEDMTLVKVF